MNNTQRMEELITQLNEASDAYYNVGQSTMTDYEWDAMFDELAALEAVSGVVLPGSPTNKVGADTDMDGAKEYHEYPALSLNKSKDVAVLQKWAGSHAVALSWKMDGLTLVLTYDDGQLSKILTRGNGIIGKNITYLADAIAGIPKTIPYKGHLVVRGEATISYPDFEEVNASLPEGTEPYANPRNLASGTLSLDADRVSLVKERKVAFRAFTLVNDPEFDFTDPVAPNLRLWCIRMDWLEENGFTVVEHSAPFGPSKLPDKIDEWTEKAKTLDTPVDGLVLVFEDVAYARTFTVTGHHDNGAGMAFKWADVTAASTLDHIEWSCGTTCITPVAVFDPVNLEGTTVTRASLHNITQMKKLGVGADKETALEIFKANMIIPQVATADAHGTQFTVPDTCPVCGAPTRVDGDGVNNPEILHCTNPDCAAKKLKKFARFVSKDGLDIDGLSEKKIADLIGGGYIHSLSDLLFIIPYMYRKYGMVMNLTGEYPLHMRDGWGKSSVKNLVEAVEKSIADVDMAHFFYAFSIPMCGHDVSKKLLATWSKDDLLTKIANVGYEHDRQCFLDEMKAIDGIGEKKAEAFLSWFDDKENYDLFFAVLGMVHIREEVQERAESTCKGLTFIITGSVHSFKNRAEFKAYVEAHGGKVAGSVSKNTNFLVSNEPSTSSKSIKAEKLGVPVITEDEFIKTF